MWTDSWISQHIVFSFCIIMLHNSLSRVLVFGVNLLILLINWLSLFIATVIFNDICSGYFLCGSLRRGRKSYQRDFLLDLIHHIVDAYRRGEFYKFENWFVDWCNREPICFWNISLYLHFSQSATGIFIYIRW